MVKNKLLKNNMRGDEVSLRLLKRNMISFKNLSKPEQFVYEMKQFAARNSFKVEKTTKNGTSYEYAVCTRCLKAHMLNFAHQSDWSEAHREWINAVFRCPTGHMGYYMDAGEVHSAHLYGVKGGDDHGC